MIAFSTAELLGKCEPQHLGPVWATNPRGGDPLPLVQSIAKAAAALLDDHSRFDAMQLDSRAHNALLALADRLERCRLLDPYKRGGRVAA